MKGIKSVFYSLGMGAIEMFPFIFLYCLALFNPLGKMLGDWALIPYLIVSCSFLGFIAEWKEAGYTRNIMKRLDESIENIRKVATSFDIISIDMKKRTNALSIVMEMLEKRVKALETNSSDFNNSNKVNDSKEAPKIIETPKPLSAYLSELAEKVRYKKGKILE